MATQEEIDAFFRSWNNIDNPNAYTQEIQDRAASFGMTPSEYTSWQQSQGNMWGGEGRESLRGDLWNAVREREGLQVADRLVGRPYFAEGSNIAAGDFVGLGVLDAIDALSQGSRMSVGDLGMAALGAGELAALRAFARNTPDALRQAELGKYLPDYAYLTHEAQPYGAMSTGKRPSDWFADPRQHLPSSVTMTPEERLALAGDIRRSFVDPQTGGDILSQTVGAETLPTLSGVGVYKGPHGLETNPSAIGRSYATDEQLAATEALRGYISGQGATPWTRLSVGDQPSIFVPHEPNAGSLDEINRLLDAGKPYGLTDINDVGEGYILTNYENPADIGRDARRALAQTGIGGEPVATKTAGGYPSYEGAWQGGALPATERLLDYLDAADPAAVQALQSSPDVARIAGNIRAADNQLGGYRGVNNDVQAYRNMIARNDWIDPMRADVANKRAIQMQQPVPVLTAGDPLQVHHYSENPLDVIDPNYQFTNAPMRGTERELPRPYPAQSYFGTEGYVKESNLGDVLHGAELQGPILDLSGPQADAYRAEAQKIVDMYGTQTNLSDTMRNNLATSLTMEMARQAGYTGLQNPTRNIATSFYPTDTAWKRLTGE